MGALRALENVTEALRIVMGRYGTLWNVTGRCGTSRDVVEALRGVAERYGTLRSVA